MTQKTVATQITALWQIENKPYYAQGLVKPTGRNISGTELKEFWHADDTIITQEIGCMGWGRCDRVVSVSSPHVGDYYYLAEVTA